MWCVCLCMVVCVHVGGLLTEPASESTSYSAASSFSPKRLLGDLYKTE